MSLAGMHSWVQAAAGSICLIVCSEQLEQFVKWLLCVYVSCKSKFVVRFLLSLCKAYTFRNLSYSNEGNVELLKFDNPFLPE